MVMLSLLVSGLMASVSVAGPMDIRSSMGHHCATRSIGLEERELFARQEQQPDNANDIELGAVMHFCCGQGAECPSDQVAEKAVDEMNSFLDGSKMKFNLQNVTRIDSERCNAGVRNDNAMDNLKAEVHQGNTSTLNVVYVPRKKGSSTKGIETKGVCVLPLPGGDVASIGVRDGCVVTKDMLPGDNDGNGDRKQTRGLFSRLLGRQNNGGGGNDQRTEVKITTTHEMGHWLGLPHVEDESEFKSSRGLLRRQGRGGTGNVMEAISVFGKKYKFTPDQFAKMRKVALSRVNKQEVPVNNKNPSPKSPQGPSGGPGGNNNGRPGKPGTGNRPGQNPQSPSKPPGSGPALPGDNGTEFPGSKPSKPSSKPSKPSSKPSKPSNEPSKPSSKPSKPSNEPSKPSNKPSKPSNKPSKPSNKPSKPGKNPEIPGGNDPATPNNDQGPSRGQNFPEGQGFPKGPNQGLSGPNSLNLPEGTTGKLIPAGNSIEISKGGGSAGFSTPNGSPFQARAESDPKADKSGLVHISRREEVEPEADESGSGLVHISRREEVEPEADESGSGLVHISRREEVEPEADESGLVHISRREEVEPEADESGLVHISRREEVEPEADESGSGLVYISRREEVEPEADESGLVHISRREEVDAGADPEFVHISRK